MEGGGGKSKIRGGGKEMQSAYHQHSFIRNFGYLLKNAQLVDLIGILFGFGARSVKLFSK
jgi:hypothetical protein